VASTLHKDTKSTVSWFVVSIRQGEIALPDMQLCGGTVLAADGVEEA
jgi:hypothetical protein